MGNKSLSKSNNLISSKSLQRSVFSLNITVNYKINEFIITRDFDVGYLCVQLFLDVTLFTVVFWH